MESSSKTLKVFGWVLFALIVGGLLTGFYILRHLGGPPPGGEPPPPKVVMTEAFEDMVAPVYSGAGQTRAIHRVDLKARVPGYLEAIQFTEGGYVGKGDVLFQIEKDPYEAKLASAKASLADAQAAYNKAHKYLKRLKATMKAGVSEDEMDTAKTAEQKAFATLEQAKADLKLAKLDLEYTSIKAPISGRVGRAHMKQGNYVDLNSDALATVVSLDPIYAIFSISENMLLKMKKSGQDIKEVDISLKLSDGSMYEHTGRIVFLDNEVNLASGSVTMRAQFPNPDTLLIPGQFLDVIAKPRLKEKKVMIPQAAILQDQGGSFVYAVENNNAVRKPITLGLKKGIYQVAETGVKAGELIIYKGTEKLRREMPVNASKHYPEPEKMK